MNIALWVLQILFAALFMLHAVLHLFPSPRLKGILAEQNIPVKRTIATWAEVVASLGLILPGAVSIATWLTPLAALGLAVVMVGATAFHVSRKETLATVAAASLALIMIFLACGPHLRGPAPLDHQFQGVIRGRWRRDKRRSSCCRPEITSFPGQATEQPLAEELPASFEMMSE
jgi:hypothetical protein